VDKLPSSRGTKGAPEKSTKTKKNKTTKSPSKDNLLNDSTRMSAKELA
jgi:hypothetical protein